MDASNLLTIIEQLEKITANLRKIANLETTVHNKSRSTSTKQPNLSAFSLPADQLGPMPDYRQAEWPEAVAEKMIVSKDNIAEQKFRALQIVNHIREPIKNKKILDFGCGNGAVPIELAHTAELSVGYDIKSDDFITDRNDAILSTDIEEVIAKGPYDLIILYDVLDHLVGDSPVDMLKSIKEMLHEDGVIFIRTHPWASRTGGHLYEKLNKAFLHLALTPDELAKEGILVESNLKIIRPMAAYELWFDEAGLSTIDKKLKTSTVEPFFSNDIIERIIKINWAGKIDTDTARKIMTNHFIDYKLKPNKN